MLLGSWNWLAHNGHLVHEVVNVLCLYEHWVSSLGLDLDIQDWRLGLLHLDIVAC